MYSVLKRHLSQVCKCKDKKNIFKSQAITKKIYYNVYGTNNTHPFGLFARNIAICLSKVLMMLLN